MDNATINNLLQQLDNEDPGLRIEAITNLGESGDELCLAELRHRLKELTKEHQALIIAVGKLKNQLGIK